MRVALISLDQEWENKEENKLKVSNILHSINDKNVDIVIFPEMTLTGFTMNSICLSESLENSSTLAFFQNIAMKYKIAIVFGMIVVCDYRPANQMIIIDNEGNLLSSYAKIHPFSPAGEKLHFSEGKSITITNYNGLFIGSSICYDLRFPELFQALSKECSIIVNIANWPYQRHIHWDTLLRARAIENQVFMIGVNRIGRDKNGLIYNQTSAIYDPDGNKLDSLYSRNEIDIFEFDPELVFRTRTNFPVMKDRQIELYKSII